MLICDSFSLEQYLSATLDYIKPYAVVGQGDVFGMAQLLQIALHRQQEEESPEPIQSTPASQRYSLACAKCEWWRLGSGNRIQSEPTLAPSLELRLEQSKHGTKPQTKVGTDVVRKGHLSTVTSEL